MKQLTEHFTLEEFTRSAKAKELKIDNSPQDDATLDNLKQLATVLERVRKACGNRPIIISSGLRVPALNRAVGSRDTSAHIKGLAVDFNVKGLHPRLVAWCIAPLVEEFDIDQLIYEIREDQGKLTEWVHLGLRVFGARNQVLTIRIKDGKEHVMTGVV
jgi:hypothetical protein